MPTRDEFIENAHFEISLDDNFDPYIVGTLFDRSGERVIYTISQQIFPDQVGNAIKFCATGKGNFREEIRFGLPTEPSPEPL